MVIPKIGRISAGICIGTAAAIQRALNIDRRQTRRAAECNFSFANSDDNIRAALGSRIGTRTSADFESRSRAETCNSIVSIARRIFNHRIFRAAPEEIIARTAVYRNIFAPIINSVVACASVNHGLIGSVVLNHIVACSAENQSVYINLACSDSRSNGIVSIASVNRNIARIVVNVIVF